MSESPAETGANALEWSVSELSGALKRTVEDAFGFVRVRGEISGYRGPVASGHVYFSLKDDSAKIDAVIWKGVFARLKLRPEEGLEVIATGKITTFPGKSSYQIVIDSLELAGLGALMAMLEERRKRLAAEGLFDEARKQLLPYLPTVIGVVTSPTGAVIRDILHRLAERFPRRVIVWPVRVQGETSAAEVAAAIAGFNALPEQGPIPRPDVIIVARGGGSLEDLMGFNDEAVVRAAAASMIPLVAAVGHETDWTLIDHAADLRAPTPTAAAEKIVPVRSELMARLDDLSRRRLTGLRRMLERKRSELRGAARALPGAGDITAPARQRLDLATARLGPALARHARVHGRRLERAGQRLAAKAPHVTLEKLKGRLANAATRLSLSRETLAKGEQRRIERARDRILALEERLLPALRRALADRHTRLSSLWKLADSLGPHSALRRGYALVLDAGGELVRSARAVEAGAALTIRFGDGEMAAVAGESAAASPHRKPGKRPAGESGGGQGQLF